MVKTITWNQTAQRAFDQTIEYLHDEYSMQTAEKFFNAVYYTIEKLTAQPFIGRPTKNSKTIRQINIDKHRKMFYRLHGRKMFIVDFFDTRQDPRKSLF